jgi:dihydroorotate dehydrogenase
VEDRAILNRLGFPNPGAEVAAARLAGRHVDAAALPARPRGDTIVGVNIGKSKSVTVDAANHDYIASVRRLAAVSDYLVLNVSSPNTPGLRELQDADRLRRLIDDVRQELARLGRAVPLLIKIDPDLEDHHVMAIVTLALELHLDGIVAVNTTADRGALSLRTAESGRRAIPFEGGGVSGAPLRARATDVLRLIRGAAGDKLVVISVGGVESADDVWERILAGASLVQVYTAFVYEGPSWPRRVNRELARRVGEAGASSVQELVGAHERASSGHDR